MDQTTLDITGIGACYARLRELIMDADLLPNTHHLEQALSERLALAPAKLHEAAVRLQAEGLVNITPRGGFWVLPLNPADVLETYQQLGKLEARAAYVAALHGPTAIGVAALDDAILTMEDALFRSDGHRWARAQHHFHRSLVQCSGHADIISAALALSGPVHRARMVSLAVGPLPFEAAQHYSLLVDAIRRGCAVEARDRHLAHWSAAATSITELLQVHGLDRMSA